jgi:hypothetical protein
MSDSELEKIKDLWQEHFCRPLPTHLPSREPHGFALTSLDTFVAGCITTFIRSPLRFLRDRRRLEVLRKCIDDINSLWPHMVADEREYFGDLRDISLEVLEWCGRHGKLGPMCSQPNSSSSGREEA